MAKTVLIVDDVPFARKALTEILTSAYYQIVGEASNGVEALAMYAKLRPDLVTMDIVMPTMSGIEATRKLCKADPDARIVVVSGIVQDNLIMEVIALGAKDFITKPFTPDDVLKIIELAMVDESQLSNRSGKR
ncbi:response regulator [Bdellovibrionota bacterium FG-1]